MLGHKNNGTTKYYKIPFRQCQDSDFSRRGVSNDSIELLKTNRFLCPDMTSDHDDFFILQNDFSNSTERKHFSIEIFRCKEFEHLNNMC